MTKKKAFISVVLLLILLAVSLFFLLKTEKPYVKALSLFGVTISGWFG